MKVLIVGSGRVGATLAGVLSDEGHDVTIVDVERASFAHLPAGFKGTTYLGNGADLDVLRQVGIDEVDWFLALTQGDNRNLMAAQIAKEIFGVKRVIAKVNDPIRAEIYREKGIPTLSRTTILAVLLRAMLLEEPEVGEVLMERTLALEKRLTGEQAPAPPWVTAKR
ncbi:MAG: TrkA family potassium uptake protein [Chloroflexi bacterium]|nr:TrkA family potassium uptake protein [Chloroflexota bacterium]MBI2983825.1 TrkA family potassium uptake protein [Chloroflexota bacterium]